jgi:hypothetical protein
MTKNNQGEGGQKNCTRGKSCGSSCVSSSKSCRVSFGSKINKEVGGLAKKVEEHKRARCEENWAELIVAAVLENPKSKTVEDLLSTNIAKAEPGYVEDLKKRNPKKVQEYLDTWKKELERLNITPEKVYLLGKNQSEHKEIVELQKGLSLKEKKADVMVKTTDGKFIGFSVKASSGATLTNYGIEKLLPKYSNILKETRLGMVKEAGLPDKFDKSLRGEYNNLFKGGRNPYHNLLRDTVMNNKEEMLSKWSGGLFAKTPFPMYSFDGQKLRANDSSTVKNSKFELKAIENPSPGGKGAAKTFFLVSENGKPSYVWDVRWKGSPAFSSPQIQTFRVHEEDGKIYKSFAP